MSKPSTLGAAIEAAVEGDERFTREREPIKYRCCYKTKTNTVFAFERVTADQINFWLPDLPMIKKIAEENGIKIERSIPWSDPSDSKKYGRISSLKSIPQLGDKPLWKVQVKSPTEAFLILSALP
ncbi:MAG TPA: hypothetical protein VIE47_02450 [Methylocystis sp.]|jgi:hypothetical protein